MFTRKMTKVALAVSVICGGVIFYSVSNQYPAGTDQITDYSTTLPPTAAGAAVERAYLEDALDRPGAPVSPGPFPKIMLTEAQSLKGTVEQFSKYDVIGGPAGMASKIGRIQDKNPDARFHFFISPRAYLGFNLKDPCELGMGISFGSTGPSSKGCSMFAGHWMYYAGTRLTAPISATANILYVADADASRLVAGEYIVIYDGAPGSFNNAEHALVKSVDKSSVPHKVVLAKRGFKSQARYHPKSAIVARHVVGRGFSIENWAYNMTTNGPTDASGRTIAEVMADWLADNITKNSKGDQSGAIVDGIYHDADRYFINSGGYDTDNDLVADGAFSSDGFNYWGEGLEDFYAMVRQRFPNLTLVGGERLTRGFDSLNGTQMENFPAADGNDHKAPNYGHATGADGFDSMFQRYMIQLQHRGTAESYVENLSKIPTKLYPYKDAKPTTNAPFRLAFGATLMGDGYFGQQNYGDVVDPWYDEFAVDVTPGSPAYGHAIASNPDDESAIRAHKGWLGEPLGPYVRLYDSDQFAPNRSLLSNNGFESGDSGWRTQNLVTSVTSGTKAAGTKSLHIARHQTYTRKESGAQLQGDLVDLVAGKEYTFVFAAKAQRMREMSVRVQGAKDTFLVPPEWTRFVHTFKATKTGRSRPVILLGEENVPVWIDEAYLFEGNANVFMREFDNGVVVVNATPSKRTIDLGQTLKRIKGTQDPVNNGAMISTVTLPAYDAAILVRPEGAAVAKVEEEVVAPEPVEETVVAPEPVEQVVVAPEPVEEVATSTTNCGVPAMNHAGSARLYVWEDTCSNGKWRARFKTRDGVQTVSGVLNAANGVSGVQGYKLESNDVLKVSGGEVSFSLLAGSGTDGFNFQPASDGAVCLTVDGAAVRIGADAQLVKGTVDVRTGQPCSVERASYGVPAYGQAKERATYVWEDESTGEWTLLVANGGKSGEGEFAGKLIGDGVFGLKRFKLEKSDTLKRDASGAVNYGFSVWDKGVDGFKFKLTSGAKVCLDASASPGVVYLGGKMVRANARFSLNTLGACNL